MGTLTSGCKTFGFSRLMGRNERVNESARRMACKGWSALSLFEAMFSGWLRTLLSQMLFPKAAGQAAKPVYFEMWGGSKK